MSFAGWIRGPSHLTGRDSGTGILLLVLALPPLFVQLASPVPRLDDDAVEYFSQLRSLYVEHDLDLANEYAHFGWQGRRDKTQPTQTGLRRTVFPVGPALLWLPFYAAGDVYERLRGTNAGGADDWGYSEVHIRAVCFGSWALGVLGLLAVHRVLRGLVSTAAASWAAILLLYATFLFWYMALEPVMSHAGSFALASLVLAVWWDGRDRMGTAWAFALGLGVGFAATVRWLNAALLILPVVSLLTLARREHARSLRGLVAAAVGFVLGALPQMLAWKAIFGGYLLSDPPQGRDFVRLDHPYLFETLFSSRHGLLYWTPVLWAGFLGLLGLIRRDAKTAAALILTVAAISYVNACSGDWWAGGSFSNRRFDSVLPILALGLGVSLELLRRLAARAPGRLLAVAGLLLTGWNFLLMEQYRREVIPRDDTVSFWRMAQANADLLTDLTGTPLAWPANWIYAARHEMPAARYDGMVGKYLFYRQGNLNGLVDLGDDRVDPLLLGEGWTMRTGCGGGEKVCRGIKGRARLFAPLDVPEALEVVVRANGEGLVALVVNARPAGEFNLGPDLEDHVTHVPRDFWRRELNEVVLELRPGGLALVDRLVFERRP